MLEAQEIYLPASESVRAAPFRSIVSLTGAATELGAALGVPLPAPGRVARRDGVSYLWSGREMWLAMADDPGLEARLRAAAGPGVAVTDQSDGRFILLVDGARARKILAKLVPIDLAAFDEDATALTLAGHIPVQIFREGQDFALACLRSFAGSLHQALVRAETGRG